MARLSNTVLNEAITLDKSSTLQHYQDDPLIGSGSYGSFIQNHIMAYNFKTYEWICNQKHTPYSSPWGTTNNSLIWRSMKKSRFYHNFSNP